MSKMNGTLRANIPPLAAGGMPKVGRGNPPKHTRFQKGVSGNKNGRPKGSKNSQHASDGSGSRSSYRHD